MEFQVVVWGSSMTCGGSFKRCGSTCTCSFKMCDGTCVVLMGVDW